MPSLSLGANVTDRRFLRYFLVFLLVAACSVGSVFLIKAWRARSKRLALYAAAQTLFDADYYRTTYALMALSDQAAFQHYMAKGYKDLRNPSADFDATFYERLYLADYAGKVHGARQNPLLHYVHYGKAKGALMHSKFIKKAVPLVNPKYYLCVAAIFRDEARFLKEWIEYYLMMGVEHFYLTNHLSKDNYMEVLQPYIDKGLVTLRHETQEITDRPSWGSIQNAAYQWAVRKSKKKTEWLLICDTDEFLVPYDGVSVKQLLDHYNDFASVSFHWKIFGTSGVEKLKKTDLMLEQLIFRATNDNVNNGCVKSIIKPRYVNPEFQMGHCPRLLDEGFLRVNAMKVPILWQSGHLPVMDHQARFYHYRLRDRKFFKENKQKYRGKGEHSALWQTMLERDAEWSVCDDKTMMRFVPELKRRMGLS